MDEQEKTTCPCCGYSVKRAVKACGACGEPQDTRAVKDSSAAPAPPAAPTDSARLIFAVLALMVVGLFYRVLVFKKLEQTALLFIGIPAVLAVTLALVPTGRSITATIVKSLVLGLCFSCVLPGEGAICILMAAAPALLVGLIVGVCADVRRMARGC